jgi:hypothetical protein
VTYELGAEGAGGRAGVPARGEGTGGAGEVERDRRQDEPGGVGREPARRQVRQRPVLEVGDDMLDDRARPVGGFGLQRRQGAVGEHRVVAVGGDQLALPVCVVPVGQVEPADPADDEPGGDVLGLTARF